MDQTDNQGGIVIPERIAETLMEWVGAGPSTIYASYTGPTLIICNYPPIIDTEEICNAK